MRYINENSIYSGICKMMEKGKTLISVRTFYLIICKYFKWKISSKIVMHQFPLKVKSHDHIFMYVHIYMCVVVSNIQRPI